MLQSCPRLGLTHGLGWVVSGCVEIFSFQWVERVWVHYSKSAKIWKDYADVFKARLGKFWLNQTVKFDFTTDLSGIGYWPEEVMSANDS